VRVIQRNGVRSNALVKIITMLRVLRPRGNNMLENYPKLITTSELADFLNVHRNTILKLVRTGKLKSADKKGMGYLYDKEYIENWLNELIN